MKFFSLFLTTYVLTAALFSCGTNSSMEVESTFEDFLVEVEAAADTSKASIVENFLSIAASFPIIEDDSKVYFVYTGNAESVKIAGDETGWSPELSMTNLSSTDLWYYAEEYEFEARLEYKFVINGTTWILDPRNPNEALGGFGANSELSMPGVVPPAEIEYNADIPHGTISSKDFTSDNLMPRTVQFYLPPGYEESADTYKVAIFHDGQDYLNFAKANNVIDNLLAENKIEPIIGIFVPPVQRNPEYSGMKMERYTDFVINEVMAWVDANYRTKTTPQDRAVMGASNGGNISLWMATHNLDIFGNVGAHSSNVVKSITDTFTNTERNDLNIYLDLGKYDIPILLPLVRNLNELLTSKGYEHTYAEYPEGHSWNFWRAHIDDMLIQFFPKQ